MSNFKIEMSCDNITIIKNGSVYTSKKNPRYLPTNRSEQISQPGAIEEVQRFLVKMTSNTDPNFVWPPSVEVVYNYNGLINGYCVKTIKPYIRGMKCANPNIEDIYDDLIATASVQTIPPFITRVGADHSTQNSGNGSGSTAFVNINIFIVDTGISHLHQDLNVVGGANFATSNINTWYDNNGHGTHVAGIAGARDNDIGIVGVAPRARLWAIKVLDAQGSGFTSNIIAGLNWIKNNRNVRWQGKGIVNMSLGGPAHSLLDQAVESLAASGIISVVAAGNQAIDAANISPARAPSAITVGATSPNPGYITLADYSNYGNVVDILAPGTNILSTYPPDTYAVLSGTSMAAPVVTGTIAVLFIKTPVPAGDNATLVQYVRNLLIKDSSIPFPKNKDGTTGSNPRIIIPAPKFSTNISVWAGTY